MRRLIVLSRVALLGLSAGAVYGDSAPVNPPEPIEVTPGAEAPVSAPAKKNSAKDNAETRTVCGNSGATDAEVATIEPTTVSAPSSAPASNATARTVPGPDTAPVATRLPDLNKPDPARLTRQVKSGYYVNTVRVLLPAGIKVTVRKDWYARDIIDTLTTEQHAS